MARRSAEQIRRDRQRIIDHVVADGCTWVRVPEWASAHDVATLVRDGRLARKVKREWDRQRGYAANLFGGAGVMQRHRAYIALPSYAEELRQKIANDRERSTA